ncbi:hypothetical protein HYS31_00480 [Candidatus Woesearchaeota archaeon]|nr:hypothetical protein [Candidatus Woesearchaeota archaeon]
MLRNKNGGAPTDEAVALFIVMIFLVVGFIWIKISNVSKENTVLNELSRQKEAIDAQSNLYSFLSQRSSGYEVSDIIIHSYYNNDYAALESLIRNFFNQYYSNDWIIIIEDQNSNTILSENPNNFLVRAMISMSTTREEAATAYLPVKIGDEPSLLNVRLLLVQLSDTGVKK